MKPADPLRPQATPPQTLGPTKGRLTSSKIRDGHLERLAIVYVRQSSTQQVLDNRESTERQYALADYAQLLGWPKQRVVVIDDDQGHSGARADNRAGYQRLLAEITLDHVGLVLGLEMSRLARSSKDWHHLLELCALFGALLADQDGVYDPADPNDRMLLGLKGTMSEVELHTMRNRLDRGRLNKALRGELFLGVPMGYVLLPNGTVALDPDEQARAVVQLVFDQFDQIGTAYGLLRYLLRQGIALPVRPRGGPNKGELDWRRPRSATLCQLLHHPFYAGAYAYGRRRSDPKARYTGARNGGKKWQPMDQWQVLLHDRLPGYISWERYLANQQRLRHNQSRPASPGVPGQGAALLAGLLVCGGCGRRLRVAYRTRGQPHYRCCEHLRDAHEQTCYGLRAAEIDQLVSQQALRSLEPAALELSLQAQADVQQERSRLDANWQQSLKRARYDVELAQRRYRAVDPDNRLVAAALEKDWNEALLRQRQLSEDYDRFLGQSPPGLTESERATIQALSSDIPALWQAPGTSHAERKQVLRCLIERVVVRVQPDSEYAEATIHWKGGQESQHAFTRPVKTYGQLRDGEALLARVAQLRQGGGTAVEIAATLNREGFRPPQRPGAFTKTMIYPLLKRLGQIGNERDHDELLGANEWWLTELAGALHMSSDKLRDWASRGWVHWRQTPRQGYRVLWADAEEVKRLKELLGQSRRGRVGYSHELTTPKPRPQTPKRR
jgi:DNA invertase Pin-like site-specific DNA recombinase